MNEHPWHLPSTSAKHYQWFRNLADFHELTLTWIAELKVERPTYVMTRGYNPEIADNLWMLDSLAETRIERLLDDTSPDDVLGRLERTVWAVQAWTLTSLIDRTPAEERAALDSALEHCSWRAGRKLAETRWSHMAEEQRGDLRLILAALSDSPMGSNHSGRPFLVKRATRSELQLELHACPHQVRHEEVGPVANELCRLHSQWVRGFVYGINTRASVTDTIASPRCLQRWHF